MIKEIKTEKFKGVAVLLPDGTIKQELLYHKYSDGKEYHLINYSFSEWRTGGFILWYKDFGGRKNYPKKYELQLIGVVSVLTEEQCADIVESFIDSEIDYGACRIEETFAFQDYTDDENAFDSAKESFQSLIQSLECEDGNWIILKKL